MPKKQPKNAFYFYMLHFKEEQRQKGINYQNLAEVADAAGPSWKDAPPSVRAKFENRAKQEKEKLHISNQKFTSTGIPLAEIEQQERELREAEEAERRDIKNFVKLKSFNGSIVREDIYLIDVNFYCKTGSQYLIGESTILRFNLEEGIKDNYHEIINPGQIPIGYTSDVKIGSQELGLDMPDDTVKRSNYMQILANTIDYLNQKDRNAKCLPPIFTMPDKIAPVQDFIIQMCTRAAEDDSLFRVYKLDLLFYTLINSIKMNNNDGFPRESLALMQLQKDPFKYTPGLGCEHHEAADKALECTLSRSKRWAYAILDSCCPILGIDALPGRHLPHDLDMDGIHSYKEQRRGRAMPSVAGVSMASSSCNTTMTDTFESSATTVDSQKREHVPLRMPKTQYSQSMRPAPDLTEANFPKLCAGRGRGLAGSFNKMRLDK